MRRALVMGLAVFAGLAGWASPADARLFSTTGPVIAILAGDLFLGEAEGSLGGSGTMARALGETRAFPQTRWARCKTAVPSVRRRAVSQWT